jgi:hypothetical protein
LNAAIVPGLILEKRKGQLLAESQANSGDEAAPEHTSRFSMIIYDHLAQHIWYAHSFFPAIHNSIVVVMRFIMIPAS